MYNPSPKLHPFSFSPSSLSNRDCCLIILSELQSATDTDMDTDTQGEGGGRGEREICASRTFERVSGREREREEGERGGIYR